MTSPRTASPGATDVVLPVDGAEVHGTLTCPDAACGLVVFAHGSGSSRFSPRNQHVAARFQRDGLGTLLFDLLTADEHARDQDTAQYRFDIPRLAVRLVQALDWANGHPATRGLPLGLFGASTGAAAALVAAAARPALVRAVVSRGGRADLAGDALAEVRAPTLLLVGALDTAVLSLNRGAARRLTAPWQLDVVPAATHLFEEPGALEDVADRAAAWFLRHLVAGSVA
jgi:putative phosphoribosyl transferase